MESEVKDQEMSYLPEEWVCTLVEERTQNSQGVEV
jgi:hypothetical protein